MKSFENCIEIPENTNKSQTSKFNGEIMRFSSFWDFRQISTHNEDLAYIRLIPYKMV